jgi:hypothetical protein
VASEHLPQGPTRPLNKGLLVGANWARGLERTSQLGATFEFGNEYKKEQTAVSLQEQSLTACLPSILEGGERVACARKVIPDLTCSSVVVGRFAAFRSLIAYSLTVE